MMSAMRSRDAQPDEEPGDFVPAPIMVAPDGGVQADSSPAPPPIRPPPRLCEAGPCVHYHRFAIQMDVETPKGDTIEPGGMITGSPYQRQPFHVRIHHYCYPDVGIEADIGDLPVIECNRWEPKSIDPGTSTRTYDSMRDTVVGKTYQTELAAWKAEQAAELEPEEDAVVTWLTMNLRDDDHLDVFQAGEWVASHVAGSARTNITSDYLKELNGPGSYQVLIKNRVSKTFEVL